MTRAGSGCVVRLALQDFARCANIWDVAGQPELVARLVSELAAGDRITLVYARDGAYLGEGSVVLRHDDPDYTIPGRRVYLSRLVVKRECRNQGIGGTILDALIAYADAAGYDEMVVAVDVDNHVARHLYEKKGFTTVLRHARDAQGEYVKLLRMRPRCDRGGHPQDSDGGTPRGEES